MKQFLRILLIFVWGFFFSANAEIPLSQIKGLATILKPDHQDLSPLNGAVVWKSRFVENLYRYGADDNPTVKLVKKLFYLQPDNVTFGPTVQVTNLATYFDEALIGKLIKASICEKDEQLKFAKTKKDETLGDARKEAAKDSFKIILNEFFNEARQKTIKGNIEKSGEKYKSTLAEKKQEKESITNEQNEEVDNLVKAIEALSDKNKENLNKDLKSFKNNKKAQGIISNYRDKKTGIESIDNLIIEFLNLINRVQEVTKDIKSLNRQITKEEGVFLNIQGLVNDQTEELEALFSNAFTDNTFVPFSAKDILLAWLWRKANSKGDYQKYFEQLNDSFFNAKDVIKKKDWLEGAGSYKSYSKDDMTNIIKDNDKNPEDLSLEDFVVYQAMFESINFPPFVRGGLVSYKGYTFADCGETALRNFFNVLLWNSEARKFDTSILTEIFSLTDNSLLVKFYKKYPGTDKIESHDTNNPDANAYDNWAAIVSGLPKNLGIIYRKEGVCNIAGTNGVSGIEKIIGHLLKQDGDFTFEVLSEKLGNSGIELYINNAGIKNNLGIIEFTLQKLTSKIKFLWKFMSGHFVVSFQDKLDDSELGKLTEQTERILNAFKNPKDINTKRKLLVLLANNVSKLCHANKESELQKQLEALSADQKVNLILNSNVNYTIGFAIERFYIKDTDNKTWKTLISKYLKSITLLDETNFKVVKALIETGKDDDFKDELKKIAQKTTDPERIKWMFKKLIETCGEDHIPEFWIDSFNNLKELNLSDCYLKNFPAWLLEFSKLEKMYAYGNPDIKFDEKIKNINISKLKELNLHSCNLKYIPEVFSNLSNLKELFLAGNPNITLQFANEKRDSNWFKCLEKLGLNHCDLKEFPLWTSKFPELEELDLARNKDIDLKKGILEGSFNKLKKLGLSDCKFKEFPLWASKFPELETLILGGNKGIAFKGEISKNSFNKLKKLILISCNFKEFPLWTSKFPELEELDLRMNKDIDFNLDISEGSFNKLKKLILISCNFKEFPLWTSKFPELEELDLSLNKDIDLNLDIPEGSFNKLKKLYLRYCNLNENSLPDWIQKRIRDKGLEVIQ